MKRILLWILLMICCLPFIAGIIYGISQFTVDPWKLMAPIGLVLCAIISLWALDKLFND